MGVIMQAQTSRRPTLVLVLLTVVLLFTAIGGVYGGYHLLRDPSGGVLGMSLNYLDTTPFSDYTLPAFVLMFGYGFGSLVVIYGLWFRVPLPLVNTLEHMTHEHWSWDLTLALGVALILWLTYQVVMIPAFAPIQFVMYGVAILLIGLPLLDPMREYYHEQA